MNNFLDVLIFRLLGRIFPTFFMIFKTFSMKHKVCSDWLIFLRSFNFRHLLQNCQLVTVFFSKFKNFQIILSFREGILLIYPVERNMGTFWQNKKEDCLIGHCRN